MDRTEAIDRLLRHEAELKGLGVERLLLSGSTAREDAGPDSDVDLFFDYERGEFGLYELMDVRDAESRILGCRADVMTRDSIHKVLRLEIEATAIPVF